MNLFRRMTPMQGLSGALRFKLNAVKNTGHSASTHRSNRAKNGIVQLLVILFTGLAVLK